MVVGLVQAAGCDKPSEFGRHVRRGCQGGGCGNSATAGTKSSGTPASSGSMTAKSVLEKMAAAYKNATSYEDFGTLESRLDPAQEHSDNRGQLLRNVQRPNKLRVEFFNGKVVCDGKQWYASCDAAPGQAVLREAPAKLNMNILRADGLLYSALNDGERVNIAANCYCSWRTIRSRPGGWIAGGGARGARPAGRLRVLSRPREACRPVRSISGSIRRPTLAHDGRADSSRAAPPRGRGSGQPPLAGDRISSGPPGGRNHPGAFQFEISEGVKKTRVLVQPSPYDLLGQKLPEFKFADLQGKPWSSQSLAGKAAVIYFWRSDAMEGDPMVPMIEQLHAKYKDNDKVAVLAVSLDHPDTPSKMIEDAEKQLKLTLPLLPTMAARPASS